jgi:hypothetical protein
VSNVRAAEPEESTMPPAMVSTETWTGKFLTTIGTGFCVAVPASVVTIATHYERIDLPIVGAIAGGFWIVGGILLFAGLSWPNWAPRHELLTRQIGRMASSIWVWILSLAVVAVGPAFLVAHLSASPRPTVTSPPQVIHAPATPEEIARAAAPQVEAARQAETQTKAREEALQKQVEELRQQVAELQNPPPPLRIPTDEITIQTNVWKSISQEMDTLDEFLDEGSAIINELNNPSKRETSLKPL